MQDMEALQLRVYNTMTRQKEVFVPLMETDSSIDVVRIYSCGPTVYGEQHVGNMRAFYVADMIKRVVKYIAGYPVKHTTNITDVGHLTDDGDAGEDKLEKGSRRDGVSAREVAATYTELFLTDLQRLGMDLADTYSRATDYIPEQIRIVQQMYQKGLTYVIPGDGIYCDTKKVADYGKLLPPGHLEGLASEHRGDGAQIDATKKKQVTDFALWKFSPVGEQRQMEWLYGGERSGALVVDSLDGPHASYVSDLKRQRYDAPVQIVLRESLTEQELKTLGFPGWHVECSAMSWATLGTQLDIHTGGIDHIPVHHTNEIAQSECSFCCGGKKWVKYWMHLQFLNIGGEKIAKSVGNIETVSSLLEGGIAPLDLRYFFHQAHYRSFQDFTWANLQAAQKARANLSRKLQQTLVLDRSVLDELAGVKSIYQLAVDAETRAFVRELVAALFDDIAMPQALAVIQKGVKLGHVGIAKVVYWVDKHVLGLELGGGEIKDKREKIQDSVPQKVLLLAEQRWEAKQAQEWARADELREEIAAAGYVVEDGVEGWVVSKK